MEDALALLEEELSRETKESIGPVRRVDWDQSLVELTHTTRSPIPFSVIEAWSKAQQRADCGLFAELHHAWASLDQTLYIWDYCEPSAVHSLPGDSAIISIALCPTKSDAFGSAAPEFVLVMATRVSVTLVGLTFNRSTLSNTSEQRLQMTTQRSYSAPTDGAFFHSIRSTPGGRIFLLSGAPHVYELTYSAREGWFRSKCRLVRHFIGLGSWRAGRLRVMAISPQGHLFICDDHGTLRLCLATDLAGAASGCTLQEIAALSAAKLAEQVRAVIAGSLASKTMTHLFSSISSDGHLQLDACTAAGERLHFVCSVGESTGRKYGFWLQRLSGVDETVHGQSHMPRGSTCLEEHPEPSFATPGGSLWLSAAVRRSAATAADLAVSLRLDRLPGDFLGGRPKEALEMQGLLNFDAPILDIAPEQIQSNCQRFAVMLTDRVEVINILPKAPASQQAPQTAAECCNYLCGLASKMPGSSYEWFWTLDDVRFPTFEEQRRAQLLQQNVPSVIIGRWPRALLLFLASRRDVWMQTLLVTPDAYAMSVVSIMDVCKRRRCNVPPVLAVSTASCKKLVAELSPIIHFVREGLSSDTMQVPVPCSAAARSQLYVNRTNEGTAEPAKQRVKRAMLELIEVMERWRQLLAFVEICHTSGCVQSVLQHPLLQESKSTTSVEATAASMLLSMKLRDLVLSPQSLWPVVQLCNALILEVVRLQDAGEGLALRTTEADSICRELQERCPAIFSEIDVRRCTKDASRPAVISVLQRYAGALGALPEAVEGLRSLAAEDAAAAAQLCADKITALPNDATVLDHARDLVAAVLDAIRIENLTELSQVLELFLQRTQSWRCGQEKSQPVIHIMLVDHLLSTPRLHGLLDVMVSKTNAVAWAEILQQRASKSRMAAELLWRYHQQRGQVRPEWAQLQRLVEAPQFYSLKDRIRHLRLAQERKSGSAEIEKILLRLRTAEKLQLPLFNELQEVAAGTRQESRRLAAKKSCHELNHLQGITELFEVAGDFGLWHLKLAIAGFSGVKMAHDVVSTLWVSLLFPPTESLYCEHQVEASPRELFPLLMLRPHHEFFLAQQVNTSQQHPVEQSLLRRRTLTFLHELREVAPENHHLWEARCVGTLLEFSNCLWLQNSTEAAESSLTFGREEGDASAGSPLINETCWWVATEVLTQEPFSMTLSDLVTFYAEMISSLHVWHKDLQDTIPAYLKEKSWLWPSEEDVHLHLSQVATVVLSGWLREAERLCSSSGPEKEKAERQFAQVWRRSADSLLAGLYLRLNGSKHATAQRLLIEVLRLEKSCRLLLEQVVYLVAEKGGEQRR